MSVILNFQGAAGTVTGSKVILEHDGARLLVDAGLYQGERSWRRLNWEHTIDRPEEIDDVVLTHAHLDHCGYLPALVRQGFHGPVWTSAGTADSCRSSSGTARISSRRRRRTLRQPVTPSTHHHSPSTPMPMSSVCSSWCGRCPSGLLRPPRPERPSPCIPQGTSSGPPPCSSPSAVDPSCSPGIWAVRGTRSSSHAQTRHPLTRWCWNRRTATASTRSWPGWMSTSHWPRPSVGPLVGAGRC